MAVRALLVVNWPTWKISIPQLLDWSRISASSDSLSVATPNFGTWSPPGKLLAWLKVRLKPEIWDMDISADEASSWPWPWRPPPPPALPELVVASADETAFKCLELDDEAEVEGRGARESLTLGKPPETPRVPTGEMESFWAARRLLMSTSCCLSENYRIFSHYSLLLSNKYHPLHMTALSLHAPNILVSDRQYIGNILPKKVLQIYSEIWLPDFDSEKWLNSLFSMRLN